MADRKKIKNKTQRPYIKVENQLETNTTTFFKSKLSISTI